MLAYFSNREGKRRQGRRDWERCARIRRSLSLLPTHEYRWNTQYILEYYYRPSQKERKISFSVEKLQPDIVKDKHVMQTCLVSLLLFIWLHHSCRQINILLQTLSKKTACLNLNSTTYSFFQFKRQINVSFQGNLNQPAARKKNWASSFSSIDILRSPTDWPRTAAYCCYSNL